MTTVETFNSRLDGALPLTAVIALYHHSLCHTNSLYSTCTVVGAYSRGCIQPWVHTVVGAYSRGCIQLWVHTVVGAYSRGCIQSLVHTVVGAYSCGCIQSWVHTVVGAYSRGCIQSWVYCGTSTVTRQYTMVKHYWSHDRKPDCVLCICHSPVGFVVLIAIAPWALLFYLL
jgi:hypothetical protein